MDFPYMARNISIYMPPQERVVTTNLLITKDGVLFFSAEVTGSWATLRIDNIIVHTWNLIGEHYATTDDKHATRKIYGQYSEVES
jgi:hypothetical protein